MERVRHNYGTIHQHTNTFVHAGTDLKGLMNWKEKLLSLADGNPDKVKIIKPLIQFLVATIAPAKIYMMKQPEQTDHESSITIDLLIVMSGKSGVAFTELEPIINIACLQNPNVVCSLHQEGSVLEALRNGHIFYSLHCTTDNLVYDDKVLNYPVTSPECLFSIKQKALQTFNWNFRKAKEFYSSAESLYQKYFSPLVMFMLHQSTEFIYRGIMQSLNGYDKKTHEIRVLTKSVRHHARRLNTVFNDNITEGKQIIQLLDKAYIDARYEEQYSIDEKNLEMVFEKVNLLQELAKQVVTVALDCF